MTSFSSDPLPTVQILAPVIENKTVAPRHCQLTLRAPAIAQRARAGQFVHVLARSSTSSDPLLRRAFSIMGVEHEEITILFRVEGEGTAQLAAKGAGERIDIIGPLGKPFDTDVFHVKQGHAKPALRPILVGGGVGVPPLLFLAQSLSDQTETPLVLIGARGKSEVLGTAQLRERGVETHVATDDGSLGHQGRVTDLLEVALKISSRAVVYACGPLPMLRAVAAVARQFGVPCQVSLEENMPCGIGVCNGCVVALRAVDAQSGDYGRYQRVCVAGPALWADRLDWEAI